MIGVGASVTSYSCRVPLSSNHVVTESVQNGIDSVTDNGDGTTTIVLPGSAPSDHFNVDTADFNAAQLAGLPFFLEAPAVTGTDNSTYSSDFQARYISMGGESVDDLPVLYRGGQIVLGWEPENGTSYTVNAEGIDAFLKVQLGVALFSPSGGETPVTALTEIQAATPHTPKSAKPDVSPSYVVMDWSDNVAGDPAEPVTYDRFVVAAWFTRDVINARYIWDADHSDSTPGFFQIRVDNDGTARVRPSTVGSIRTPSSAPIGIGDRVCMVTTFEVGGFAQSFISLNGGDFLAGEATVMDAAGSGIHLTFDRTHFMSRTNGASEFTGRLERLEFFTPTAIITPQSIKPKLVTREGRSPIHALARQDFGEPIFAFDGDPGRMNALDFDGTFNPTSPSLIGSFVTGETA